MGSGAASRMRKPSEQPLPALAPPTPLPSLLRQQYDIVTAARLGQRTRRPAQAALRPATQPRMPLPRRPAVVSSGY